MEMVGGIGEHTSSTLKPLPKPLTGMCISRSPSYQANGASGICGSCSENLHLGLGELDRRWGTAVSPGGTKSSDTSRVSFN